MIKRILFSLLSTLFFLLAVNPQMAVFASYTQEEYDALTHGTSWYIPSNCDNANAATTGGVGTGKIYMVGDSITQGTESELQTAFKERGFSSGEINGLASRRLSEGGDPLDGITVLQNDKIKWKDAGTIVVALGTNGGITDANVGKTIDIIKADNSSAKIFWVNIGADNTKRGGNGEIPADTYNATLENNKSKGYSIIDWAAQVKAHPDYIDPNPSTGLGVHPAGAGKKAFADTVATGATGSTVSVAPQTQAPPKSFWARVSRAVAAFFNPVAFAEGTNQPEVPGAASTTLSNRDKIAQMLMVRVDSEQEANDAVGTYHVGGFYISNTFNDAAKVKAAKAKFSPAAFVGIDEEGGKIDRLGILTKSAREMGGLSNDEVKQIAKDAAIKMKENGIDVDLAPVLDLDSPNSKAIGQLDRSFSSDPNVVAEKAAAFAQGLQEGGIFSTYKHFPGIGNTTSNSDFDPGATSPSLDELTKSDLVPYEKVLSGDGKSWVMLNNYIVPGLTNGEAATVSKPAYDLLRNYYKYNGISITDDLAAKTITTPLPQTVEKAIMAGADVALFTGAGQLKDILDHVEEQANNNPELAKRIDDSSKKIMEAKAGFATPSKVDACSCSSAAILPGSDNAEKVWNFFASKQLPPFQIAGIMGNMQAESGINPRRVEGTTTPDGDSDTPSSVGYGLVQFTPGTKILASLDRYNQDHSTNVGPGDLSFQLELIWAQLDGGELATGLSEKGAGDALKQTTNVTEATHVFLKQYERAGIEREEVRQGFANDILTKYGSGAGGSGSGSSDSLGSAGTCPSSGSNPGGLGISADGFVFPLQTTKDKIKNHKPSPWCYEKQENCHHDYNAADIFADTGTTVVAARGGQVVFGRNEQTGGTGSIIVVKGDDNNIYSYIHLKSGSVKFKGGETVKAGDALAEVGTDADAQGTPSHLHFDVQPPPATTRQGCTNAACAQPPFNFINPQPALVAAYNALPDQ